MAKPAPDVPAASLALYDKLLATHPKIDRKGAKNPYTSLNGHMFSFLTKDGRLGLRLSAEDREAFMKKHKAKLCVHYNTVMKEYVEVPPALFKKTGVLKKYLEMSYDYIESLKPKPTTRKKKVKKKVAKKKVAKKKTGTKKKTKK